MLSPPATGCCLVSWYFVILLRIRLRQQQGKSLYLLLLFSVTSVSWARGRLKVDKNKDWELGLQPAGWLWEIGNKMKTRVVVLPGGLTPLYISFSIPFSLNWLINMTSMAIWPNLSIEVRRCRAKGKGQRAKGKRIETHLGLFAVPLRPIPNNKFRQSIIQNKCSFEKS